MSDNLVININSVWLIVLFVILIIVIYYALNKDKFCFSCIYQSKENFKDNDSNDDSDDTPPPPPPVVTDPGNNAMQIYNDPKLSATINRQYNPLEYPYRSDNFYDQKWYPNLKLPFQVIGLGYRNQPGLGGTQIPIMNPPVPIVVNDDNIAPVNISTQGPIGRGQQVGVLYKIYGNANDILPLFGRKRYANDNQYDYWTLMGPYSVKVPVVTKNRNDELGNNDVVFIKGFKDPYRVNIYELDLPAYIPYV